MLTTNELPITYFPKVDFRMKIFEIIRRFSIDFPHLYNISKFDFLNKLSDFVQYSDNTIKVFRDVSYDSGNSKVRVDLIFKNDFDELVMQIIDNNITVDKNKDIENLLTVLETTSISNGVLLYKTLKTQNDFRLRVECHSSVKGNIEFNSYSIY